MNEIPTRAAARGNHASSEDDGRTASRDAPGSEAGDEYPPMSADAYQPTSDDAYWLTHEDAPLDGVGRTDGYADPDVAGSPADPDIAGSPADRDVAGSSAAPDVAAPLPVGPDHVDLDSDPFADDLSSELAAAAPKRWADRATLVLGALALLVGGFLGGVQVEKHYGSPASAAATRRGGLTGLAGAGGFTGGGFNQGGAGGIGATASPTTGTAAPSQTGKITLVDGTTVYVTLANGDVLTVRTTTATKVTVGSATKVSQLKAGQTVTVVGSRNSDGEVAATAITAGP